MQTPPWPQSIKTALAKLLMQIKQSYYYGCYIFELDFNEFAS